MKFSNGFWLKKEGLSIYSPTEVKYMDIDEESFTVYAACRATAGRGDTVNEPLLSIRVSSPIPDVIRVQLVHFKGTLKKGPEFSVSEQEDFRPEILNEEAQIALTSGKLCARLIKSGRWGLDFFNGGTRMTGTGHRNMGYITTWFRDSYTDTGGQSAYMREQLALDVGECIYGLGERFTPLIRNGQSVDIWNEDGGTASEQAYKSVPFYISNKGYGVLVSHPECVSFEIGTEVVTRVQFSVPGEHLEYYIIGGASMKEVLSNYTQLTGRPALPPAWSFGLWLTTSFTPSYDEGTVNSFIQGMTDRDLPLHVFHFDCFWMKEYHLCDFTWDERVFPDPAGMLARLKNKGLKICVWINPYISQKSRLFDEGMKNGYLLRRPDGNVWQIDMWQPGMGLVDFTNPSARHWFAAKLEQLVDMGVDCFKTDFGERIPTDAAYYDGSDAEKMHNYYTFLYNKTVYDMLKRKLGENEAVLFARSATVGGQQFPVHWGGDCSATYESMAESLRGGLSLCLSGFGFWSHDISGFENTATPDLYKRWAAFGLLSSHSRLHGSHTYRVPWEFDDEAVDVLRSFTKLKCSLMPYIFAAACRAAREGTPVMRAMVLEFNDPTCDYLDRQYMLGDSLLVAPIFKETGEVTYYLPEGKWVNFLTGETVEGGGWRNERHGYMSLPLMARPNSIIAVGSSDSKPDYDYADGVTLQVFDIQDGCNTSATVYNTKGQSELVIHLSYVDKNISVCVSKAEKPWSLLMRGPHEISAVRGASTEACPTGIGIKPFQISGNINIQLK